MLKSPCVVRILKSLLQWARYGVQMDNTRNVHTILVRKQHEIPRKGDLRITLRQILGMTWVLIALMTEAVQTSETLVNSYQSTWRYNLKDSHLQILGNLVAKLIGTVNYSGDAQLGALVLEVLNI
jgi:hypothetical protein